MRDKRKFNVLIPIVTAVVLLVFTGSILVSQNLLSVSVPNQEEEEKNFVGNLADLESMVGEEDGLTRNGIDEKAGMEEGLGAKNNNETAEAAVRQDWDQEIQNEEIQNEEIQNEETQDEETEIRPDVDYSAIANPVIMIDPGHGGFDNGCQLGTLYEKDINYDISLKIKSKLEGMGYTVVFTRTSDVKVYLEERVQAAADCNADVFVSIHQNLYTGKDPESVYGVESYFNRRNSPNGSERLCKLIQTNVINNTGTRDRGAVEANDLVLIRKIQCPAVLIECGFLSCTDERNALLSEEYQDKIAAGIADAIDTFFQ